jgi:glycerol uptake facilitator protein
VGPATGAAINPARYIGTVFMQNAFGGKVLWSQVPAYLIGELGGGMLGGLAWALIGRTRADASFTSLAPEDPVPAAAEVYPDGQRVSEGRS